MRPAPQCGHERAIVGKQIPWLAAALLAGLGACATGQADGRYKKLEQRLEEMSQRESSNNRRIEDLNTRLFLVEDKVEGGLQPGGGRATSEAPRLPVIRIGPHGEGRREDAPPPPVDEYANRSVEAGEANATAVEDVEDSDSEERSVVANSEIEYSGNALKSGPRPLLRIRGIGRSHGRSEDGAVSIDPAHVTDRLPVVPLPSRKTSRKIASQPSEADAAMSAYRAALKTLRGGKAEQAAAAFGEFLVKYPKHAYVDNAMYWQGECYYDLQRYKPALKLFRRVVREHPRGNKAPDALLKMGFSYLKLGDERNARAALTRVEKKYPGTRVAGLARKMLSKLN